MKTPENFSHAWTRHPIVYEDEVLIAIDKPEGVLSHPNARGARGRHAFEGPYDPASRTFETPMGRLWLLHRLDQDSSGLLLGAKKGDAAQALRAAFEEGKVQKTYLALVRGHVKPLHGRWKDHLAKQMGQGQVRSRSLPGRPPNAESAYEVHLFPPGARWMPLLRKELSLLEIQLITGRTHQIRVQAAARQHPLAGDRIYGNFEWNRRLRREMGLDRLFLHAWSLKFRHPATSHGLSLKAPLPAELAVSLEKLGVSPEKIVQKKS